jgi:hypothetical protein
MAAMVTVGERLSYIFYAFFQALPRSTQRRGQGFLNKMAAMRTRGEILSTFLNLLY